MRLSLRIKLLIPALISAVFMCLLGGIGIFSLNSQEQLVRGLYDSSLHSYPFSADQNAKFITLRTRLFELIALARANASDVLLTKERKALVLSLAQVRNSVQGAAAQPSQSAELLQKIAQEMGKYEKGVGDALDFLDTDLNMATMMLSSTDTSYQQVTGQLQQLVKKVRNSHGNKAKQAASKHVNGFCSRLSLQSFAPSVLPCG